MKHTKKVVIAGGTGFIGQYLQERFHKERFEVLIISRSPEHIAWQNEQGIKDALEDAELLINLAGKSVDCRYTKKNKALILNSRVETTRNLQAIVEQCDHPPGLWINASTATIYRHSEDKAMDEDTGEIGTGFSVEIAKSWEAAFFENSIARTRKVALRIAITLGKKGGVMKPYLNLVKFGLGGRQGNGRQMFSWIHVEDLYRVIQFVMKEKEMKGVYNASSPNPVTNKEFMQTLRNHLKPVVYLPAPAILLKIGALLINTETELVLKSRWVIPGKLEKMGFQFRFAVLEEALKNILNK